MQHKESHYENGLYWQTWQPENPVALLLLAHGLAEHSGRYAHVAEALCNANIAVFAIDHIGHGQSGGDRCMVDQFSDFTAGIDQLYETASTQFPGLPVFILGHSMGGLIAALSIVLHPTRFAGAVLTGPAILPVDPPPAWQEGAVRFISKWLPATGVIALEAEAISRDPDVVQRYFDDPLVYNGKVPARLAAEIFDGMALLRSRASEIRIPLLVMHGEDDRLTAPEGSVLLMDSVESSDKTLVKAENAFHELFNEPDQEIHISRMLEWLKARC